MRRTRDQTAQLCLPTPTVSSRNKLQRALLTAFRGQSAAGARVGVRGPRAPECMGPLASLLSETGNQQPLYTAFPVSGINKEPPPP
jgi:hypothetical protein